jgi:hypothetical protein
MFERRPSEVEKNVEDIKTGLESLNIFVHEALVKIYEAIKELEEKKDVKKGK